MAHVPGVLGHRHSPSNHHQEQPDDGYCQKHPTRNPRFLDSPQGLSMRWSLAKPSAQSQDH
jgi:hypothetical protein